MFNINIYNKDNNNNDNSEKDISKEIPKLSEPKKAILKMHVYIRSKKPVLTSW